MEPAYGIENKAGGQGAIPMNDPYAQPAQQAQPPQYNQYNYPPPAGHPTEHQQQYTGGAPAPVQSPGPQYHQPSPQVQVQPIAHGTPTQQPSQGYFPDKGQHTPATTTVATPGPTQQPTSRYQTATPLHALSMGPAPVDCPACGKREVTRVTFENGNTTHAWAALLCFCLCLGCIPYMMKSTKDVNHNCGSCGTLLACVHNSGKVDVLQHR